MDPPCSQARHPQISISVDAEPMAGGPPGCNWKSLLRPKFRYLRHGFRYPQNLVSAGDPRTDTKGPLYMPPFS